MSMKSIPLEPNLIKKKLRFAGVYLFFLIFALKHRLQVLVRTTTPSREGVSHVYPQCTFRTKIHVLKNQTFPIKFSIFTDEHNFCILHEEVFLMVMNVITPYCS